LGFSPKINFRNGTADIDFYDWQGLVSGLSAIRPISFNARFEWYVIAYTARPLRFITPFGHE